MLAAVTEADGPALIAANRASAALHTPWVAPPTTPETFRAYLASPATARTRSGCWRAAPIPARSSASSTSARFRGPFNSAYLGFYAMAGEAGQGRMTHALRLAVGHAFGALALHRVEANIQPANARSIALVRRLNFRLEGFSPRYLHIAGAWRDHERWAITAEEWEMPADPV